MSALVYDYMSSTYINTHSHINHKVCWKLLTANPGVIYTRLCGIRRPPHFDLSLIHSVTYSQLNMQSYVQVSSFSPSAPQTDVKKLLCARKCRFGKSTQWFKSVLLETHISENRCYQGKGAPDSRLLANQRAAAHWTRWLHHTGSFCVKSVCVYFSTVFLQIKRHARHWKHPGVSVRACWHALGTYLWIIPRLSVVSLTERHTNTVNPKS